MINKATRQKYCIDEILDAWTPENRGISHMYSKVSFGPVVDPSFMVQKDRKSRNNMFYDLWS